METKICKTCGENKPLDEFHKYTGRTARSADGHRAECKQCRNEKERERQRKYREARKQAE